MVTITLDLMDVLKAQIIVKRPSLGVLSGLKQPETVKAA